MSKNTGTSELINYFDLGVNGDVGISGNLTLDTIANAVVDTDKFLVSDNGIIKYRTGAELLSDIGAAGSFVTLDTAQTITGAKTFSSTTLQLAGAGSADPTILRNTSGDTGSTTGFNTIGFNNVNNLFVSTQNRGGFILGFNNSVSNRTYTLPDASGTIALTSSIPANPIGGTGTTNYLPKFTGASTIGNSQIFDDGTNIGIGTASPASNLQVASSSSPVIAMNLIGSATSGPRGDLAWYNSSISTVALIRATAVTDNVGTQLEFYTRPSAGSLTQAMTITSGGNVGINVTPTSGNRFWVKGSSTSSGDSTILAQNSAGTNLFYVLNNGNVVMPNGNLLVGTTTDNGARLQVSGTSTFGGRLLVSHSTSGNYGAVIYNTSATGEGLVVRGGSTSSHSAFVVQPYDGSVSLFNVLSTGAATFSSSVTANGNIRRRSTDSVFTELQADGVYATGTDLYLLAPASRFVSIYAGNAERMRITSSGNVGIGTASPNAPLHVVKDLGTGVSAVARLRGSNSTVRTTRLQLEDYNGTIADGLIDFIIPTAGSSSGARLDIGVNGANISLVNGGNVLIGTTTDNGARLQVSGAGTFSSFIKVSGAIDVDGSGSNSLGSGPYLQFGSVAGNRYALQQFNGSNGLDVWFYNGSTWAVKYTLSNVGAATFSSTVTATGYITSSDLRLKEIIEKDGDLAVYKRKGEEQIHYGYIAQEMQESYPNQVHEAQDGYLSVNYVEILVKKVNELEKKIKQLEK